MVSDAISSVSVVVDWSRSVSMDDSGVEDLLVGVEGGEFGSGVGAGQMGLVENGVLGCVAGSTNS